MRASRKAILAILFPAIISAQTQPSQEPFTVVPPGITVRMERFTGLEPAGLQQIRGIVPDRQGFLWCFTNEGIARFDGYDTKVFRTDLADTLGKYRTAMGALVIDGKGLVWGATVNGGLQQVDPSTGTSRWYYGRKDDTTSIGTGASVLLCTSDGELWAGGRFGLARFDRPNNTFIRYGLPRDYHTPEFDSQLIFPINALSELGRSIWIGLMNGGLVEFDRDHHAWTTLRRDPVRRTGPSNDTVTALCGDRNGNLWVGSTQGLDRYEPRRQLWTRYSTPRRGGPVIPCRLVRTILEDATGQIWISVQASGVYRYDPATGVFSHYVHDASDPNSFPGNSIYRMDAHRPFPNDSLQLRRSTDYAIVWFCQGMGGVNRAIVRRAPHTAGVIRVKDGDVPLIIDALSYSGPETLWAGIFNRCVAHFDLRSHMVRWYPEPGPVWRLARLQDNAIIVSAQNVSMWVRDTVHDTFVRLVPDLLVADFLEDPDGTLWLACYRRQDGVSFLVTLDRKTGRRTVFPRTDPDSASYRDGIIARIADDGRGAIWYGTFGGGLIRFDRGTKTYKRYAGSPGVETSLNGNHVAAIVPDSGGMLWVGTHAGLNLMDCASGTFEHIHSRAPHSDLYIRDMVDDGAGNLWIAAHQNAVCFNKRDRTFRNLSGLETAQPLGFWTVNVERRLGTVTFGGGRGFFQLPLDAGRSAEAPPPVVFTSFKVFEKEYPLEEDVSCMRSITLPASASFFSFTFAVLDYLDAAKNQYSYRMEGADPEWVFAGSRRYVSYSNLDPGTYVLRVKGSNSEGLWNEEGASIEIIIEPPWYRTAWAKGAYLIIGGSFLYLLYRFDRRRTALKHRLQMKSFEAEKMYEVDRMKSRFFANISHEFRTPLTLILGPIDQMMSRSKDEDMRSTLTIMRRNGLRLLQLINQLLDLSKMDAGKMHVQVRPLDIVALVRLLVMSFKPLAERKTVQLVFDPEDDEIIAYLDRDKVEKIVVNLLSNAFKFTTSGGEVRIALRRVSDESRRSVEIVIADTGIGIGGEHLERIFDRFYQAGTVTTSADDGSGIGLALVKELVDLLKGSIEVHSAPGRGSTFTVHLPCGKECWGHDEIVADEILQELDPTRSVSVPLDGREPDVPGVRDMAAGKPSLLVVEDNADVRTYLRELLREEYNLIEAANGNDALERIRDAVIDIVISDIMMPGMDGIELCKILKKDDRTSHIPVVLLTALATGEGRLEGLGSGADDYVTKPFDGRELRSRVKNLIDTRRMLRDRYGREVTLGPTRIQVTTAEGKFLKKFAENVEKHIADTGYDTETLAHDLCMSRMQLNRKLHALTGHSTHELVREFRLQRAADLLDQHADNVSGVAFEVGFNSLSHFARAFREKFGVLPSEYAASKVADKEHALHA